MSVTELFLRPVLLALALGVPVVWWTLRRLSRARARRRAEVLGRRASLLAEELSVGRRRWRRRLFAGALLAAVLALAGPAGWGPASDVAWRGVDVVVALDVSRSMLATDVLPSRLGRARAEIAALAAEAGGDRLALVLFAGRARLRVPLTTDVASVVEIAGRAEPADVEGGGTDLAAALDAAAAALEEVAGEAAAVVLLTDGEDLEGRGLAASRALAGRGVPVHCVGVGSAAGAKIPLEDAGGPAFLRDASGREVVTTLDAGSLARIAEATGGRYVDAAETGDALRGLYARQILPRARAAHAAYERSRREDLYRIPLLAAIVLFLLELALSERARRPVRSAEAIGAPRRGPRPAAVAAGASLIVLLLVPACDGAADGADLWRAGRRDEAYALWRRAAERAGARASPALSADLALGAADAGEDDAALRHAAEALAAGGAAYEGVDAFVRGWVAFRRSVAAEAAATPDDAGDEAYQRAVRDAEDALGAWRTAAASRADWPEARRNVERALLRLERLREKRVRRQPRPREVPGEEPRERPPPSGEETVEDPSARPDGSVAAEELPADRVLGVLDLLRKKEAERLRVRREERVRSGAGVERDW